MVSINLKVRVGFPGTGVGAVVEFGIDDCRVLLAQGQARYPNILRRVSDAIVLIGEDFFASGAVGVDEITVAEACRTISLE